MSGDGEFESLRIRVRAALDKLPMRERAVYLLSALDDLTHEAIAFRLGIGTGEIEEALGSAIAAIERTLRKGVSH